MSSLTLRPRTDPLLRAWKNMIQNEFSGTGFEFRSPQQIKFKDRVDAFCSDPSSKSFDEIWTTETAVEHSNPGSEMLRTTFDGDIDELAAVIQMIRSAPEYNQHWEQRFTWSWALWELYTRLNESVSVVLTSESSAALSWLGAPTSGTFRERIQVAEQFREHYCSIVGHPTQETPHETPIKTELDELFHAIQTLTKDDLAAEIKGPYGEFYRYFYGGSRTDGGRTGSVELFDIASVVRAYASGEANDAYDKPKKPEFWGGTYWENWKEEYAEHVRTEIREQFTLDDLSPEEIAPLFKAITTAEGSDLSKPVATYVMGSQWGQYTWNDIVDHFSANPVEASQLLSLFFDDSYSVVNRLDAFKEHTIHLTETEDRSPGSIERMATSLLMFTNPEEHIGLPPARTKNFLNSKSTLPKYESGFRPKQYRTIIGPLRELRDEIRYEVNGCGSENTVTMLDVHSMIWIYGGEGEPTSNHI